MEAWELRPEEATGFDVEEDQDTFLLEHRPYPGLLPWGAGEGKGTYQEGDMRQEGEQGETLEWESLRELLVEELERTRAYWQQYRQQNLSWQEESVEAQPVPSAAGQEVIEVDLREFPPHPTTPLLQPIPVSAASKEPPQSLESRKGDHGRRPRLPLELLLLLLVIAGGVFLWQWSSRWAGTGELHSVRDEVKEAGTSQVRAVRAPFRQVESVEPLMFPEFPLLQLLPTSPTPPKNQPKTPTPSHSLLQPPSSSTSSALFVVQVYASTSQADALEIAEQLQRRGLPNVSVSPAYIRGQTWWRVRFGPYTTRLQAEEAALRAGFSHAWVLRLQ